MEKKNYQDLNFKKKKHYRSRSRSQKKYKRQRSRSQRKNDKKKFRQRERSKSRQRRREKDRQRQKDRQRDRDRVRQRQKKRNRERDRYRERSRDRERQRQRGRQRQRSRQVQKPSSSRNLQFHQSSQRPQRRSQLQQQIQRSRFNSPQKSNESDIRATPLKFASFSSKSSMSHQLKVSKEKAQFVIELIELISSEPDYQKAMHKSLQERILQTIKAKTDLEPESRNYFEQFFTNGVQVDKKIFPQERIQDGLNPQSQRLVFYPTYMVTGQIFRFLKNPPLATSLFTGQPGIAKTTSVCLFYYLAKIIDEYRFMEGVQVDEKMKKIPKIVYWPIVMTNYKLETIKQLILQQCPEINNQKYIKEIDSFKDYKKIFEYYKKVLPGVRLLLVTDQIETLKSQQRKFAEALEKRPYQLNSQQETRVEQIFQMFESIQNIILHFSTRLYLSSMNLENNKPQTAQFTSCGNQPLPKRLRLYYPSILYKPHSMIELVKYFLFEVEQRIISQLKNKEIYEKTKQKLCAQCYSYLENRKSEFFVTPLDFSQCIRSQVENQQRFQQIKNICVSQNSLKQQLFNVFKQQIDNTKERYVNLLKENFQKNDGKDRSKKKLMLQLYQRCQKFQKNKQLYEGLKKEKYCMHRNKINIKNLSWSKKSIVQLLDPRFFDFQYIDQGFIEPLLPIQFLQNVLTQYFSQNYDEYLRYIKYFLKGSQNPQQFGNIVKNLLFLILKNGKTHVVLRLENIYGERQYNVDFNFDSQTIFGFQALPKVQSQQYSLLSRLKDKIDQMIKMRKTNAVFFPLKKEFLQQTQQVELQRINENSKMIDLIWIKCDIHSISGQIIVWVIDVTASAAEVQKKILDFIKEFLKSSDRHQTFFRYGKNDYPIKVNYVVFGPKVENFNKNNIFEKFNLNRTNKDLTLEQKQPLSQKMLKIKSLQDKQCLLDYVGYVDMSTDLTFEKEESEQKKTLQSMEKLIINRLSQKINSKSEDYYDFYL